MPNPTADKIHRLLGNPSAASQAELNALALRLGLAKASTDAATLNRRLAKLADAQENSNE